MVGNTCANMTGEYQLRWGGHLWQRTFQRHSFHHNPRKNSMVIQAVAVPVSAPVVGNDEERKQMCENYGFTQIGEPLPDDVTMRDIISTLPKKVFWEKPQVKFSLCLHLFTPSLLTHSNFSPRYLKLMM